MWKKMFMLVLLAGMFYAAECDTEWLDPIKVRIFDANYRPIANATVNFTYQKDYTTGKGYITTKDFLTDSTGTVETSLRNSEKNPRHVDCDITINVYYDGVALEREVTAQHHSNELHMLFDAYQLRVRAVDKLGKPITNNPIRVNEMWKATDGSGYATFQVNAADEVEIAIPYKNSVVSGTISVEGDMSYTFQALLYSMRVSVVDDSGNPLVAEVTVENETFVGSGFEVEDMALARPAVTAVYGSLEKNVEVDLSQKEEYTIVFDLTPPDITNVQAEMTKDGNLKITFNVNDPNAMASGPSLEDTEVSYSIGGSTYKATPYVEGGKYVAEIIQPPENSLVRFTIVAKDKEGNMKTVEGEYLVTPEEEPGNGGAVPGGEEPEPIVPGDPLLLGVAAIVGLVLLWLVYNYVKGIVS